MSTVGNFIPVIIWYNLACNSQGAPLTLAVAFFITGWKKSDLNNASHLKSLSQCKKDKNETVHCQ